MNNRYNSSKSTNKKGKKFQSTNKTELQFNILNITNPNKKLVKKNY
jgi:hypothetical protein